MNMESHTKDSLLEWRDKTATRLTLVTVALLTFGVLFGLLGMSDKDAYMLRLHVLYPMTHWDWLRPKPGQGFTGIWREWSGEGNLLLEVGYRNGVLHGRNRIYDEKGNLFGYGEFRNGKAHGVYVDLDDRGRVQHTLRYRHGVRDGVSLTYYAGRTEPLMLGTFTGNRLNGASAVFDMQGNAVIFGVWRNGFPYNGQFLSPIPRSGREQYPTYYVVKVEDGQATVALGVIKHPRLEEVKIEALKEPLDQNSLRALRWFSDF